MSNTPKKKINLRNKISKKCDLTSCLVVEKAWNMMILSKKKEESHNMWWFRCWVVWGFFCFACIYVWFTSYNLRLCFLGSNYGLVCFGLFLKKKYIFKPKNPFYFLFLQCLFHIFEKSILLTHLGAILLSQEIELAWVLIPT